MKKDIPLRGTKRTPGDIMFPGALIPISHQESRKMMKQLPLLLTFFISLIPVFLYPGSTSIAKVGEWGTGYYHDVFIKGNYAYCAADEAGLDIIDISNPANPRKTANINTPASAVSVYVEGSYAYVGETGDKDNFLIIDITNPYKPIQDLPTYNNGIEVIDISQPESPEIVGNYDTPGNAYAVYVRDNYAYTVWVDGVLLDHPVYNRYREDIDLLFPGYNNSKGAGGYFYLDTTQYNNGVHTISWSVTDDAGNTDGIGSRYFIISNNSYSIRSTAQNSFVQIPDFSKIPVDYSGSVGIKKGYNHNIESQEIYPGNDGVINIEIYQLQPIKIDLNGSYFGCLWWTGLSNRFPRVPIWI